MFDAARAALANEVEPADARELLSQAKAFVDAARGYLGEGSRGADGTPSDDA